jgi:hypothetical protein
MQIASYLHAQARGSSAVLTSLVTLVSQSHIYCALLDLLQSARSALRFRTLAEGVDAAFRRRHREGIPEYAVRSALLAMLAAGLVRVRHGRILLTRVGRTVSRLVRARAHTSPEARAVP